MTRSFPTPARWLSAKGARSYSPGVLGSLALPGQKTEAPSVVQCPPQVPEPHLLMAPGCRPHQGRTGDPAGGSALGSAPGLPHRRGMPWVLRLEACCARPWPAHLRPYTEVKPRTKSLGPGVPRPWPTPNTHRCYPQGGQSAALQGLLRAAPGVAQGTGPSTLS